MSLDKPTYFEGSSPIIIPHRGGSNIVPENTLHGFQMVLDEGFSHYETDLRMTKDGEIVLHHCLLYTSPSPRDAHESRMPSSA